MTDMNHTNDSLINSQRLSDESQTDPAVPSSDQPFNHGSTTGLNGHTLSNTSAFSLGERWSPVSALFNLSQRKRAQVAFKEESAIITHCRPWKADVYWNDQIVGTGFGHNKKEAKNEAAANALQVLALKENVPIKQQHAPQAGHTPVTPGPSSHGVSGDQADRKHPSLDRSLSNGGVAVKHEGAATGAANDTDAWVYSLVSDTVASSALHNMFPGQVKYQDLGSEGPDHRRMFSVQVKIANTPHQADGNGPSKKAARQAAALNLLKKLRQQASLPGTGGTGVDYSQDSRHEAVGSVHIKQEANEATVGASQSLTDFSQSGDSGIAVGLARRGDERVLSLASDAVASSALNNMFPGRVKYSDVGSEGPDHSKTFHVQVEVADTPHRADGSGPSKKAARQAAALAVLQQLEHKPSQSSSEPVASEHTPSSQSNGTTTTAVVKVASPGSGEGLSNAAPTQHGASAATLRSAALARSGLGADASKDTVSGVLTQPSDAGHANHAVLSILEPLRSQWQFPSMRQA